MSEPPKSPEERGWIIRDAIAQMACVIGVQSEIIFRYAELGDDAGLAYATKNLITYTKACAAHLTDLQELIGEEDDDAAD